MGHFAKVEEGIVTEVIVADQDFIDTLKDKELWIQTSYNTKGGVHLLGGTPLRKNYASVGFRYDEQRDAFIPPKPFDSWILNEDSCTWEPPVPKPEQQVPWFWNEISQKWYMYNYDVNSTVIESRIETCEGCPFFNQENATCSQCGCSALSLHINPNAICPEGKW